MKRFCTAFLLAAAVSLFGGCSAKTPEETVLASTPESASMSASVESVPQKTPSQEMKKPETGKPGKPGKPGESGKNNSEPAETEPEEKLPEQETPEPSQPEKEQPESEIDLRVQWLEDAMPDLSAYDREKLGLDEGRSLIYFSSDEVVREFKSFTLVLDSFDDDGTVHFSMEDIYEYEDMMPGEGIVFQFEPAGAIPNTGISYLDNDGKTKYFAVEVSGYDGSLLLSAFTPD